MGEARDVADRMTAAVTTSRDLEALAACYSEDAVAITPDQGEITGRDGIVEYFRQFLDAFTDTQFEHIAKYEPGNVAIDEGYIIGTNTGTLQAPGGESFPATGRQIRVRECDVMVVADGLIQEHRFYHDQMELLGQLVCFRTREHPHKLCASSVSDRKPRVGVHDENFALVSQVA